MKTYVITDIHGCFNTFEEMLNKIGLTTDDELILLGDYIDRGPRSIQIIDKITHLIDSGYNLTCLTGNHEQMMLDSLKSGKLSDLWTYNGGASVLKELGIDSPEQIPQKYLDFAENLHFYHLKDDYIFVHAGLKLSPILGTDPLENTSAMVWTRNWENQWGLMKWLNGRKVVYGHTPQSKEDILDRFDNFSKFPLLNIDNGCVFEYQDYNSLCCYNLTDSELYFVENCDF